MSYCTADVIFQSKHLKISHASGCANRVALTGRATEADFWHSSYISMRTLFSGVSVVAISAAVSIPQEQKQIGQTVITAEKSNISSKIRDVKKKKSNTAHILFMVCIK